MASDPNRAQAKFVQAILLRCSELGWTEKQLCQKAGISRWHWEGIRDGGRGLSFRIAAGICCTVGLELTPTHPCTPH